MGFEGMYKTQWIVELLFNCKPECQMALLLVFFFHIASCGYYIFLLWTIDDVVPLLE